MRMRVAPVTGSRACSVRARGGGADAAQAQRLLGEACTHGYAIACMETKPTLGGVKIEASGHGDGLLVIVRPEWSGERERGAQAKALERLERRCIEGDGRACFESALLLEAMGDERSDRRAAGRLGSACDEGRAAACVVLGVRHMAKGEHTRARQDFERACSSGDLEGCANLAVMIGRGLGGPADDKNARVRLEHACRDGAPTGCYNLAVLSAAGRGGPVDRPAARSRYGRGCELGYGPSCLSLSSMVRLGQGGGVDAAEARRLRARACQLGVARACQARPDDRP
jgi:TPR repeat protein